MVGIARDRFSEVLADAFQKVRSSILVIRVAVVTTPGAMPSIPAGCSVKRPSPTTSLPHSTGKPSLGLETPEAQ
jgi:hypothetical protein